MAYQHKRGGRAARSYGFYSKYARQNGAENRSLNGAIQEVCASLLGYLRTSFNTCSSSRKIQFDRTLGLFFLALMKQMREQRTPLKIRPGDEENSLLARICSELAADTPQAAPSKKRSLPNNYFPN
jgi:hypothetical protein